MEIRNILMMVLLSLMSGTTIKAQFNTVGRLHNHQIHKTKNPQEINTSSLADNLILKDSLKHDSMKEQIARYMSVSYPLSKIKINSPYGYRKNPFSGKRKFHNGLDLHARNAKVLAMMAGEVVKVGHDRVSGKYVILKHGDFIVSYCHLSRILAYQGQSVKAGEIVGITGSTGRSTGEHLHITCKFNGNSIDPMLILKHIEATRQSCVAALTVL
ncbi:M23 family metallopeptidase [Bacteroides sp. ET336]|uniref:M23 family metallopeptidase n=1 Tax=Bacteroides sp. ET336 TaxID=2972459 RepID=UPI0021ABA086|nr:M23 family metallopeptidase [Bacteroides sp. ET336]MCR8894047.1 M23 family metallopeptidase [Bacteroides sp. ET336]MDN0058544.1 M23 family metallopeptidase [Bacteroides caecigallinarum]